MRRLLAMILVAITACGSSGPMMVGELLEDPAYGQAVTIEGEVALLGELFCPCFELTSGGGTVMVWYDLMEADGQLRPAVSVAGIANGDVVEATGELREPSAAQVEVPDFWATAIDAR